VDIVDEILKTHLSRIEQRRGLSFLVLAEIISFGDKSLNRKVSDNIQIYVDRLRLLLADGLRAGLIRQDLDLEAAFVIPWLVLTRTGSAVNARERGQRVMYPGYQLTNRERRNEYAPRSSQGY